jgi:peroxidase
MRNSAGNSWLARAFSLGQQRRRRGALTPTSGQTEVLEQRALLSASPIGGEGNNVSHPEWGTPGSQFVRIAEADYADDISTPAGADRPSAREISNAIVDQGDDGKVNRDLWSAMIFAWGQFLDHDLDLTNTGTTEPLSIAVPQGDPFFDPTGTGTATINTQRSVFDAATGLSADNPRQQTNALTAFIDGSMVYGSDISRATALRTLSGGKLKTSEGNLLPLNSTTFFPEGPLANAVPPNIPGDEAFVAGDIRVNENVVLTAMQTLWVREHNFQATEIARQHPDWSDEQIYQGARARVVAEIQAITYNEFLPTLLGRNGVGRYEGYDATVNPGIANEFATAGFRVGHTLLGETIRFLDNDGNEVHTDVSLRDAFFNVDLFKEVGVDPLLKFMASDPASDLDNKIVDSVRNFLFGPPGAGGFDLASLNITRGRDHGLADYNSVREAYGLHRVREFSEITHDVALQDQLRTEYGSVDNIDLWVGALAEDHRRGEGVGETLRAILVDQFSRLRAGDRFWYENQMSRDEIARINHTSLSDIIRRNSGVENIQKESFFFRVEITGRVFPDGTPAGTLFGEDAPVDPSAPPDTAALDDQFAPPLEDQSPVGARQTMPGGQGQGGPGQGGPGQGGNGPSGPRRPALPPRTVQLLDAETGDVIDETTTNARGEYRFDVRDGLRTGSYRVRLLGADGSTEDSQTSDVIDVTRGSQRFGHVDFGIPPAGRSNETINGSGDANEHPSKVRFYRAYNPTVGSHFFTASQAEFENSIRGGYQDESTNTDGFEILAVQEPGTVALYRLYNLQTGRHYYTSNAAEADFLEALVPAPTAGPDTRTTGWRNEGVAGYVFASDTPGTTPVFRLYNSLSGSHLFTESAAVRDAVLSIPGATGQAHPWQDHGVVGRAFAVTGTAAGTGTGSLGTGSTGTGSTGQTPPGPPGPGGPGQNGPNDNRPTGGTSTGGGTSGSQGPNGGLVGGGTGTNGPNTNRPSGGTGQGGPGQGGPRPGGPGQTGPGQGGSGQTGSGPGGQRGPQARPAAQALVPDTSLLDSVFASAAMNTEL